MKTEEFLQRVLPHDGTYYFSASASSNGPWVQSRHESVAALAASLAQTSQRQLDVYFATGSFTGERTHADAELKKCFYVDLDVGTGDRKYSTKKDAVMALISFSDKHFTKPSLIVNSGGGIHAYWVLTKAVPPAAWQRVADQLKNKCKAEGFLADTAVTADAARVMRVPGSTNYKHDHAKTVDVVQEGEDYALSYLESKLTTSAAAHLSLVVSDDDLSGGLTSPPDREYFAKHVVSSCPMFKDAAATGGADLSEALWNQQVHLLAFCKDGIEYVHEISKGYAQYSEKETNIKWQQKLAAKENSVGPTTCNTFSQESKHCATCEFRGKVKSPLHLGDDVEKTMPWPYGQDSNGIFVKLKKEDKDGNVKHIKEYFTGFNIKEFRLLDEVGGAGLAVVFNAIFQRGEVKRLAIGLGAEISDKRTRQALLAKSGVIIERLNQTNFEDFIVSWAKAIKDSKGAEVCAPNLGWLDGGEFALVSGVFSPDGGERSNANISGDPQLVKIYTPTGSAEPWKKAADILCKQKRHASTAAVLTAFASPLLHFLKDSNVAISFVSPTSGTGKTTSLQLGQAVWADASRAMNQMDDTENSIFNKLGYLNSLPAYWDEVRTRDDPAKFARVLFQLTNGREKSRLSQDIKTRRLNTWQTMMVIASNESIADLAKVSDPTSEAGRVRVFEVQMPDLGIDVVQDRSLPDAVHLLDDNYGRVGEEYIRYVTKNHEAIKKTLSAVRALFAKTSKNPNERLWLSTVTALLVAAQITKTMGFMDVDIKEFKAWLEEQLEEQRLDVASTYMVKSIQASDAVSEFLSARNPGIYIVDQMPTRGKSGGVVGKIHQEPIASAETVGMVMLQDRIFRVNRRVFGEFCREKFKRSAGSMLSEIKHSESRRVLAPGVGKALVRTYDIELTDAHVSGMGVEQ